MCNPSWIIFNSQTTDPKYWFSFCILNFRKSKATNSAHVLMNLFFALFLLNVAFLSNEYVARAKSHNACKVMAAFMHYSLLASFTWFAVEALHLCLQMSRQSVVIKHYILKISVIGWGEFKNFKYACWNMWPMIRCTFLHNYFSIQTVYSYTIIALSTICFSSSCCYCQYPFCLAQIWWADHTHGVKQCNHVSKPKKHDEMVSLKYNGSHIV